VVSGDGDGVGGVGLLDDWEGAVDRSWARGAYTNVNLLPIMMLVLVLVRVMMTTRQLVGCTVKAVAEGVVVTCWMAFRNEWGQ
jgi:hypothetical protein